MSLTDYLKRNWGEILLVVASAWAVAWVATDGFFLSSIELALGSVGRGLLTLALVALLVLLLYLAAFRRQNLAAGVLLYIAVLAVMVGVALALSTGENLYEDAEGNYLYFVFVVAGAATGAFLLTRSLMGSYVWFILTALICSVIQAFYESEELLVSVVAVLAGLALIVHKNFKLGAEQADRASAPSSGGMLASSLAPVAVVVVCGLGIWFGIIAPLDPGVVDLKLITEYRALPVEELKGTADEEPILNLEMTSDDLEEGLNYTTDDLLRDPTSSVIIESTSLLEQQLEQEQSGNDDESSASSGGGEKDDLDEESLEAQWDPMSYSKQFSWIVLAIIAVILVIALIVGYFVGRRLWRTRRLKEMLAAPDPADQVKQIYRFLLDRLRRIGFEVPEGMTLTQWAESSAHSMQMLTEVTRVPFTVPTAVYSACVYGDHEPSEDEVAPVVAYYLGFWKAARVQLGNFRYFFKSFRL